MTFFGDTTFNCLQLDDLQNDFEKFKLESLSQKELIQTIIEIIISSRKKHIATLSFTEIKANFLNKFTYAQIVTGSHY
jgi:hypothetical protein